MKKILLIIMFFLTFAGMAQAQGERSFGEDFDFNKYKDAIDKEAYYQCFLGDELEYVDYSLIDIDEDGKPELWVRSAEELSWQGVFVIEGDSVVLLAYADRCSNIEFFRNAVGYHSYVSPGHSEAGYFVLKDSRIVASAFMHVDTDIFSEEMETIMEECIVNDLPVDRENYEQFENQLGEAIEIEPVWIKIE